MSGIRISESHDLGDRHELYEANYWRCDGECNKIPPLFGSYTAKGKRPPGEHLSWWQRHRNACNGTFIHHAKPVHVYIGKNYFEKKRSREEADVAEAILSERKKRK